MRELKDDLKTIVIKVGSSSITHDSGNINLEKIDQLGFELANLRNQGMNVVLVSSGAIAAGRKRINLETRPEKTDEKQATSAIGQVALMNTYHRVFNSYNYQAAQILLTKQIEKDQVMKANAKNTFKRLFQYNVIPVVNENDTISTFEIKFGDNDTLSAVVARMIEADLLILLSDVDGLYTDNPKDNPDAKLIEEVTDLSSVASMAKDTDSNVGTGGMITKIRAAELCMEMGIATVITNSDDLTNIRRIVKGENIGTILRKQ